MTEEIKNLPQQTHVHSDISSRPITPAPQRGEPSVPSSSLDPIPAIVWRHQSEASPVTIENLRFALQALGKPRPETLVTSTEFEVLQKHRIENLMNVIQQYSEKFSIEPDRQLAPWIQKAVNYNLQMLNPKPKELDYLYDQLSTLSRDLESTRPFISDAFLKTAKEIAINIQRSNSIKKPAEDKSSHQYVLSFTNPGTQAFQKILGYKGNVTGSHFKAFSRVMYPQLSISLAKSELERNNYEQIQNFVNELREKPEILINRIKTDKFPQGDLTALRMVSQRIWPPKSTSPDVLKEITACFKKAENPCQSPNIEKSKSRYGTGSSSFWGTTSPTDSRSSPNHKRKAPPVPLSSSEQSSESAASMSGQSKRT